MTTVYLDNNFKCYVEAADGLRAVETVEFDGKCKEYIEGFCFVPDGETYTDEHGNVFGPQGDMFFAWADYDKLAAVQANYERQLMEDMRRALEILKTQNAEYESALTEIEEALEISK